MSDRLNLGGYKVEKKVDKWKSIGGNKFSLQMGTSLKELQCLHRQRKRKITPETISGFAPFIKSMCDINCDLLLFMLILMTGYSSLSLSCNLSSGHLSRVSRIGGGNILRLGKG